MHLPPKQFELSELLCKARLIEHGMARQWWGVIPGMIAEGLLCRCRVLARWPLPTLQTPLCIWEPGQALPEAEAVSYRLQSRWIDYPVRELTVYVATQKL